MTGGTKSEVAPPITTTSESQTTLSEALNEFAPQDAGPRVANGPPSIQDEIFVAAQYGDWQKIEYLIANKLAKATDRNEQGITPLHWAAINDRLLACKTLLDNGAEVDAIGGDLCASPAMWAAKSGHVYIVHLLITAGAEPSLVDNQGYNILQLATHSSNILLITYLLHIDVPVDSLDPQGHTCLMWAAYQGDALSVNLFLQWGANVNAIDHDGLSALHWAVVRGNRQCMRRIIEEGANLQLKQHEGKTPRALAIELKTIKAFESALSAVGRDPETGILHAHYLSTENSMRAVHLAPYFFVGPIIWLYTYAPVVLSVPLSMILAYGCQKLINSVLVPPKLRSQGVHKTPFLSGIFAGSAFWTVLHWVFVCGPVVYKSWPITSFVFSILFATCLYNFTMAATANPGHVPKVGGRSEQREVIEELLREGDFDSVHYCLECQLRRPMRAKHCKICNRCVARHDHHCPWVSNCIGIRNHRYFVVYICTMFPGILLYAVLVWKSLEIWGPPTNPSECLVLNSGACQFFQIDGFGLWLAAWDCLQLTWVSMLVIVQLWQIARATTTQEVLNVRRHGNMGGSADGAGKRRTSVSSKVVSALAAGTTDPGAAALDDDMTTGPPPASAGCEQGCDHAHARRSAQRRGCMSSVTRLLGVDQFVDTAKEGLLQTTGGGQSKAGRRRRPAKNPFDGGVRSNCADFWTTTKNDGTGDGGGRIKGSPVDFYRLYAVPEPSRTEMYSAVEQQEV